MTSTADQTATETHSMESQQAEAAATAADSVERASIFPWVLICVMTIYKTGHEWYRWKYELPPTPVRVTIISLCVLGMAFWRLKKAKAKNARLKA